MALSKNYLMQAWLVLALALGFGAALAGLQIGLAEKIEANKVADALGGVSDVVPGATRGEATDPVAGRTVYKATNDAGAVKGWVVIAKGSGYADTIELMFGLNRTAERITGIKILDQKETPNLGNRVEEPLFCDQFKAGLDASKEITAIKSGTPGENEVLAVNGATVSSQSVCDIINAAAEAVRGELSRRGEILGPQIGEDEEPVLRRPAPVERPENELRADNGVNDGLHTYYELRDADGKQAGWLVRSFGDGYHARVIVAFSMDLLAERITGLWVLRENETGSGPMVAGDLFRKPFFTGELSTAADVNLYTRAEGPLPNGVPAVTGATETSEAVCRIVNQATVDLQPKLAERGRKILEARGAQTPPATQTRASTQPSGSE